MHTRSASNQLTWLKNKEIQKQKKTNILGSPFVLDDNIECLKVLKVCSSRAYKVNYTRKHAVCCSCNSHKHWALYTNWIEFNGINKRISLSRLLQMLCPLELFHTFRLLRKLGFIKQVPGLWEVLICKRVCEREQKVINNSLDLVRIRYHNEGQCSIIDLLRLSCLFKKDDF